MSAPEPTPREAQARFKRELAANHIEEQTRIAIGLAPAFRDKYDFSGDGSESYKGMAEMSFKAAEAVLAKRAELFGDANKVMEHDLEAARRADEKDRAEAAKKEATK